MNTKMRLALCALALAVPGWRMLRAEEPAPAPTTGKVLVLVNERTLEGDIERVGEQYRVRRALGELWLQREDALRLCKDYQDAYRFLHSQANLRDPDEHLRLARWCQLHGLRAEALKEVSEAAELRPEHAETRRLQRNMQRAAILARTGNGKDAPTEPEAAPAPPPITAESLGIFVSKVQPLLMNGCASCHAGGKGGSFKIARTHENGLANRRTTLQNLSAALAQVNPDQIPASALLIKAVSIHGNMAQPVLKSREAAAYRMLEDWIRMTVESSPQLREQVARNSPAPGARPVFAENPEPRTFGQGPALLEKPEPAPAIANPAGTPPQTGPKQVGKPSPAKVIAEPADPYDSLIFNRQFHPERPDGK